MKYKFLKLKTLAIAMAFLTACGDDDTTDVIEEQINFSEMESDWVRLSLLHDNKIEVMQANTGEISYTVEGELEEGSQYHTSNTGRYITIIERANNKVRFIDSGIVNHGDHGHEQPAKWLDLELDGPLPTHYSSSEGHIVIFNDGDGSITLIDENQLEIPSYQPKVFSFENTVAHHGAAIRLQNGKFAVTFNDKPGTIPGIVKLVDANGNVI
ncbi:hypothetical protein [Fulvivirga sediminis]|uniref:Uncharacterized protein n=1 Tax=Fulvivirga sediminis TaxID=2803949 RepID=A0A937FEP7_9BACT|nr:hypothetical protein [Fulvivirga sediminis]MBL3659013.1 hypothetical protein [Fulvivirga sediminis]